MHDLSDAFSGEKPLTRIQKNGKPFSPLNCMEYNELEISYAELFSENLQAWFKQKGNEIDSLNIEKQKSTSRKIIQILKALEDVQGTIFEQFLPSWCSGNLT